MLKYSGRFKQRGFADGLAPLMILMLYGLVGLIVIAVLASVALPLFTLKGKARAIALLAVAIFWTGLGWEKVVQPNRVRQQEIDSRTTAYSLCRAGLRSLPNAFQVDGFLDGGAAIRKQSILSLFGERNLRFVEIQVRRNWGMPPQIAYPDSDVDSGWQVSSPEGTFIRLELGRRGDPNCLMTLPYGIAGHIDRPPFLPDTCMTANPSDAPSARYEVAFEKSDSLHNQPFAAWTFIDRTTGNRLASLTTVDKPNAVSAGRLNKPEGPRFDNCQSPHTILVDRIIGPQSGEHLAPQVLREHLIVAKVKPTEVEAAQKIIPEVHISETPTLYSEQESALLFNPTSHHSEWELAVATAKEKGWASFGSRLLDWRERRLVSLAPLAEGNSYPWNVLAVGDGFLVFSTNAPWREGVPNLLIRYASNGSFDWALRITRSAGAPLDPTCRFEPRAASISGDFLLLSKNCTKLAYADVKVPGKDITGLILKIPLKALPGKI